MKHFRTFSLLAICLFLAHLAAAQVTGSGTTNYIPIWTSSTALGDSVLYQTGGKVGIGKTAPAWALDVNGRINTNLAYKIAGTTVLAIPGGIANQNTAVGDEALAVTTGPDNTATGYQALNSNTTGVNNVAIGEQALQFNTIGHDNMACGTVALAFNTTGNDNMACGSDALFFNTTGSNNTASGAGALNNNTTGGNNIAVGSQAALNVSGGNSNNIHIGSLGTSTDSGVISIGTAGTQTSFFAAGIYGASSGQFGTVPVLVDSFGQLVTVSSSRRFKEDIHDMGEASSGLMKLRPVTFRYKKPLADGSQPMQYGLIAEEVAEVYPDLVSYAADGQIQSVKYQLLDPMLLNEVQRQHAEIQGLQERLSEIRDLKEQLNQMKATLAAMSHAPASR